MLPMLSFSQQMPHYSLYMLNDVVVNPSLISTKSENQVALMVRNQWTGFEGAPKTQSISYYIAPDTNSTRKFGKGISIINDNTGPISMISGTLSGSYELSLHNNPNRRLSIGMSANILQYTINNSDIILENDGVIDPAMNAGVADKVMGNSASIGVNYWGDKFNVSASVINIINSDLNLSNTGVDNALVNHYYLNSSYKFSTSSGLDIIPSIMFKKIGAAPFQLDLNIRTSINNTIWGGLSYRTNDAVIAMLGLKFSEYTLGYSYDVTTTKMNIPSYGSHGIVITYNIKAREKKTPSPVPGCMDSTALNFNPLATQDNGTCIFPDTIIITDTIIDTIIIIDTVPVYIKDGDTIHTPKTFIDIINLADRIHFEHDSSNINENSKIILDLIAKFLKNNIKQLKIFKIHGHTSEIGTEEYNLNLSKERALSVKNYLYHKGVPKNKLSISWSGESEPFSNSSSHAKNRRVEFIVIEN
jgi:type IX secretion system PorP/SprF family membrane protein